MEIEEEDVRDIKSRTRRRRSIRNLRDGLPVLRPAESAEDCYGSLWLETDEPVRKKKKRRSSLFAGLPALHSTPLREENVRWDSSDMIGERIEDHVVTENTGEVCENERDKIGIVSDNFKADSETNINSSEVKDFLELIDHENEVLNIQRHTEKSNSGDFNQILTEEKMKGALEICAVVNSGSHAAGHVDTDEKNESSNVSSPNVSLTKLSPSSMSPDFPVSPAEDLVSSFINHGESFIESETFITRPPALVLARTQTKADVLIDSYADLNSSDIENIPQNLDVTPAELQNEDCSKDSPSFFSLCKSIAGKVVTFVKTSPSYLTNAIMTSNTPTSILTESKDVANSDANNSSPNTIYTHVDPMPVDHSDNTVNSRQQLHEKINRTLEEMEAQMAAEIAERSRSHLSETAEVKDYAKLAKPFVNKDIGMSACKVDSAKKWAAKSTGSIRKKRDRKTFVETFNAISNVLNKNDMESADEVFASNVCLRVPGAPGRPKSRSYSTNDVEFMEQWMYEGGNVDRANPEVGGSNTGVVNDANTLTSETEGSDSVMKESETCQRNTLGSETPPVERNFQSLFHNSEGISESLDSKERAAKQEEEQQDDDDKQCSETNEKKRENVEASDNSILLQRVTVGDNKAESNEKIPMEEQKDAYTTCTSESVIDSAQEIVSAQRLEMGTGDQSDMTEHALKELENINMIKERTGKDIISLATKGIDPVPSSSGVSKRKRKHHMPVKMFTEKTSLTEVKESTSAEVNTEEMSNSTVGQKTVKEKSVVSKRKSGQFNVLPEKLSDPIDEKQDIDVSKCSAPKKKKTSDSNDQSNVVEHEFSEISKQSPLTSNIEDRISKLAIDNSAEKTNAKNKSECRVKKNRRKSAKLDVIASTEKAMQERKDSVLEAAEFSEKIDLDNKEKVKPESSNTQDGTDNFIKTKETLAEDQESQSKGPAKTKGKRRRRSSTFKDIQPSKGEDSPGTAMEVSKIIDEISQVHLKETKSSPPTTESEENQLITVDNLELPEDNVIRGRRRRRSAGSATLKIQMICETTGSDVQKASESAKPGPVTAVKGGRKRKLESKITEEELEQLYKNKNFVKPEERKPWQTIFESPATSGDMYGKKRLQRFIEFEKPTQLKLRRRLQKAIKNGWDPRKKKRTELKDDFVESKLAALTDELDKSSDNLAENIKDIVETK